MGKFPIFAEGRQHYPKFWVTALQVLLQNLCEKSFASKIGIEHCYFHPLESENGQMICTVDVSRLEVDKRLSSRNNSLPRILIFPNWGNCDSGPGLGQGMPLLPPQCQDEIFLAYMWWCNKQPHNYFSSPSSESMWEHCWVGWLSTSKRL